jgi:DNA-binding response OmpR family regulator
MSTSINPRILFAEDNALISMMIEDELIDFGLDTCGPFSSCLSAIEWLRVADPPDAAIIDVNLTDGPADELAHALNIRCVPFVVYSGSAANKATWNFGYAEWIGKPTAAGTVAKAVMRLLYSRNRFNAPSGTGAPEHRSFLSSTGLPLT